MIENRARNSRSTRYMNGLVASREFEAYTFGEYIEEVKETELRNFIVINYSQSIKDKLIKVNLKSKPLRVYTDRACVDDIKIDMSIKESYTESEGCEAGPFNNRDTIISNAQDVTLDNNERIIN